MSIPTFPYPYGLTLVGGRQKNEENMDGRKMRKKKILCR
jgi:hypothetical protein